MSFFKKKQLQPDATGDRLARMIADQIILRQQLLAAKLNKRVNRYSRQRQKWLLWIFCAVAACSLLLCLLVPYGKLAMKMPGQNYQQVHIGVPSDLPIKTGHSNTTDSLTTKNK